MATIPAPTNEVPCGECGADTMPPYTDDRGTCHPGYYCEECGYVTFPKAMRAHDLQIGDKVAHPFAPKKVLTVVGKGEPESFGHTLPFVTVQSRGGSIQHLTDDPTHGVYLVRKDG